MEASSQVLGCLRIILVKPAKFIPQYFIKKPFLFKKRSPQIGYTKSCYFLILSKMRYTNFFIKNMTLQLYHYYWPMCEELLCQSLPQVHPKPIFVLMKNQWHPAQETSDHPIFEPLGQHQSNMLTLVQLSGDTHFLQLFCHLFFLPLITFHHAYPYYSSTTSTIICEHLWASMSTALTSPLLSSKGKDLVLAVYACNL